MDRYCNTIIRNIMDIQLKHNHYDTNENNKKRISSKQTSDHFLISIFNSDCPTRNTSPVFRVTSSSTSSLHLIQGFQIILIHITMIHTICILVFQLSTSNEELQVTNTTNIDFSMICRYFSVL